MSGVVWWTFIITLGHLGFEPLSTFEKISILQVPMEDTLYYPPTAATEEAALRSPLKSGPTAGRSVAKRQLLQPRESHGADTQATLSRGCSHLRPDHQPKRNAIACFFLPIGGCFRGGPCAPKLSISLAGTDSEPRCGRGPPHAALLLQLFFPLAGVWMPSLLTPAFSRLYSSQTSSSINLLSMEVHSAICFLEDPDWENASPPACATYIGFFSLREGPCISSAWPSPRRLQTEVGLASRTSHDKILWRATINTSVSNANSWL